MFLSVFDIFKIGIGPSSSHTMGPMRAAQRFLHELNYDDWPRPSGTAIDRIDVRLHGSLAFTGKGHGTDRAVILGLAGELAETVDPDAVEAILAKIKKEKRIRFESETYRFDPEEDLVFDFDTQLPAHTNGMTFSAHNDLGRLVLSRAYYSIGGGFVASEEEIAAQADAEIDTASVPFPFENAAAMLGMAAQSGLSIADMKRRNELAGPDGEQLDARLDSIWTSMNACIERGLSVSGVMPGGLNVRRRAKSIHDKLALERTRNTFNPMAANEWLSVYAMAVNEENAAGGRVVTAPTNGAAGVIPAVLRYYREFDTSASDAGVRDFLLTAAAIGGIIKHNASISGAEVGCQGEVGSASAMAAAGLCAAQGGSPEQIENAAEIALEHHLGMTCDPVGGLVQVPCIERNALGAVKAVTAASLALRGDGQHFVPLDNCIETMRQTGLDMSEKYKETSQGGLAVNVVQC